MRRSRALCAAAGAMLLFAAGAAATTAPGMTVVIHVTYTGSGVTVQDQATMPRGVVVEFDIINKSSKPHNFSLLGKTSKTVSPGHQTLLTIPLVKRGSFLYQSTLDKGDTGSKSFRGYFIVY
jgi:hypothetical protein